MKNKVFIILIVFFCTNCSKGIKKWYSEEEICECYSESDLLKLSDFDSKLGDCLSDFNNGLNTDDLKLDKDELKLFAESQIFKLTEILIQKCPAYQSDFNEIFLNKYSKRDTTDLIKKIDSITYKLNGDKNNVTDLINLAEYAILQKNLNFALDLANKAIKINPSIESGYLLRSYIYQKKGSLSKSIEDYKKLEKITNNSDLKLLCELMILNLEQQLK